MHVRSDLTGPLSAQGLMTPIPPTLHRTVLRAARELHRSTLDPDRGYYGEAPVALWRYERAVGDATPPNTANNRPLGLPPGKGQKVPVDISALPCHRPPILGES